MLKSLHISTSTLVGQGATAKINSQQENRAGKKAKQMQKFSN